VVEPKQILARPDTIYDLASLTKVLVTGLMGALALDEGSVELSTTLADTEPNYRDTPLGGLNVSQLATHTSGLPAWLPLYLLAKTPANVPRVLAGQDPLRQETKVEYSDLNFIALAQAIVYRLAGSTGRIDSEFNKRVSGPLGLKSTAFNPISSGAVPEIDRIAASEHGNAYEKETCVEQGYLASAEAGTFRNYQIWGEVHDGNAFFMGGVAGHAGLFSNATDILQIALQFLPNYTQLVKPATCDLFRNSLTRGLNEDRSFAFQLASTEGSTAGGSMSPQSFGHNGFTGTSLWIDPVKERIFILLTNRTHHHQLPFVNINSVRRRFHDVAIGELDARNNS
jgi:CubicO group peptidase (beta-lactamase class C family)